MSGPLGGFDHAGAQRGVERAHGRAEPNWRAPLWLVVTGAILAIGVLVAMVLSASLGG